MEQTYHDVYIDHAPEDIELAQEIRACLENHGCHAFLSDEKNRYYGKDVQIVVMSGKYIYRQRQAAIPQSIPLVLVYPKELKLPHSMRNWLGNAPGIQRNLFADPVSFGQALIRLVQGLAWEEDLSRQPNSGLTEIAAPEGVEEIAGFGYEKWRKLEKAILPSSLRRIGYRSFAECEKLKEIVIPENVERIDDQAFFNCRSLARVHFGRKLKKIGDGAFANCSQIREIFLPGIQEIKPYAFANCGQLTKVCLGDSIRCIGDGAFSDCGNLSSFFIIPRNDMKFM